MPHSPFTKLFSPSERESEDFQSKVRTHINACLAFIEVKKMRTDSLKKKKKKEEKKNAVGSHEP